MTSQPLNSILLGDCLERMSEIADASVDMVLTDLPYSTTQNKWDSLIPMDQLCATRIRSRLTTNPDRLLATLNVYPYTLRQ